MSRCHGWRLPASAGASRIEMFVFCLLSRSLTKAHVKINNSSKMRDKLRNDISKVRVLRMDL